ncbi:TetR/AcrR family transcriptional regulator [Rhodococcus sp. G-MC3]|uniref:TetR/AcrR family transcriptional regulator n=1 Tax=Rhodococcus sp. G-MC3 TaxID=3046209 RepID=UPI0024B8A123|nr:TetR/AcrR family transcriptional regulator [Rhodococcus sp. G-MC3]MDJ0395841.1 TetR/AcrR family transcriptional regulator [Rhodococcus sp. G-MC3]
MITWDPAALAGSTTRGYGRLVDVDGNHENTSTAANRPAGTKGMPRSEREQSILNAAVDEFGQLGYAGASLSTIAANAGVSKPLIMNYFGSKEALYVQCVRRAGQNMVDRIETVLATDHPPLSKAAETLATIFDGLQPRPHDWNVLTDRTTTPGGAAYETAQHYRDLINAQGARGVANFVDKTRLENEDAAVLTEIWISIVTALVRWWLRHPEQTAADMTQRSYRILSAITSPDVLHP